ncbi:bifunctional hydroxymethylpyrimidine kinase/phosphomethylpyrimidine kinase [uncultured Muribaculum sp.]|uniref:bifunctional hydroxymethylpyrimidine kinase/phosphomethylpyrimidine kinase n=1 Tax=uncultured Muribaculum sp. TaxID=1918613 RepID=UPI0025D7BDB0|nr:bifunctional hydroxymethylpyrimidine kinase/phosphomethylpyrimidine kinase [uncultured Muribaculum sp.]
MPTYIPVLSIAGSDSSGGAGIQADIKTMSALGVYAMTAITAITVQNTLGVTAVQAIRPEIITGQIDAVFADIPPHAVKIGMLFDAATACAVADALACHHAYNIVLDPVMISTSGSRLLSEDAIDVIVRQLIPIADIITPNAMEAEALTATTDPSQQIERLLDKGARAILIKGGDKDTTNDTVTDWLYTPHDGTVRIDSSRIRSFNTHGTGCTLSSAIASFLAIGYPVAEAVFKAKEYISSAISTGSYVSVGHGHGPVDHFFAPIPLIKEES